MGERTLPLMTAKAIRRFVALSTLSAALLINAPLSLAEDEMPPTTSVTSVTPAPQGEGHESGEKGERIDREFEASHPLEWVAVGVALSVAIALAYTAGRRRRNRE